MKYANLKNGVKMPLEGFGVFQVPDAAVCEESVYTAIKTGYRLIDTAAAYMNEEAVGAAVRRVNGERVCTREDLFITTKLWIQDYPNAKEGFEGSLKKLGLEYIDLYLLHQPIGDYYSAWRALEDIYQSGKAKAIGVCNFYPERMTAAPMAGAAVFFWTHFYSSFTAAATPLMLKQLACVCLYNYTDNNLCKTMCAR